MGDLPGLRRLDLTAWVDHKVEALSKGMTEVVPAHRADRISRNLAAVEIGYSWVEREIPNSFAGRRLT